MYIFFYIFFPQKFDMMHQNLNVERIHFIHSTVFDRFGPGQHKGQLLEDALKDLMNGKTTVHHFPPIEVIQRYGKYWSTDNRRLYLFKRLWSRRPDRIPNGLVPVDVKSRNDISEHEWQTKFTTRNGGTYAMVIQPWTQLECEACECPPMPNKALHKHWRSEKHQVFCTMCGKKFLLECKFEEHKQYSCKDATAEVQKKNYDINNVAVEIARRPVIQPRPAQPVPGLAARGYPVNIVASEPMARPLIQPTPAEPPPSLMTRFGRWLRSLAC